MGNGIKMKITKLLFLFAFAFLGCTKDPPCPMASKEDSNGFYSKNLTSIEIDGQVCEIFEVYEKFGCGPISGGWSDPSCEGSVIRCSKRVISRITKCPSGVVSNTITYTPDKFHREQVQ